MAKIVCVLYDDPVDGYPKSYPRDGIPKIEAYPDGQTTPSPKGIDFKPGELDALIAEGERSIQEEGTIDGEQFFKERRKRRVQVRKKGR